jgi:hypothetical protein
VVRFLSPYRQRLRSVPVDAIGIGHNFGLHLRDQRFPVELINVSAACESRPGAREKDPAARFVNLKAQYYQEMADAFERREVQGLRDDMTIGQLGGILYEVDSHGRIKIESKESARMRGIPSPDRAEALMLALCKPPQIFEWHSIREFGRFMSNANDKSALKSAPGSPSRKEQDAIDDAKGGYRGLGGLIKSRRWKPGCW